MTKIIDLPTTASTDANTFVPVYKNGKTQKVSATALGGGGSGGLSADFTSLSSVATVNGTEIVPVNKPTGTILKTTIQAILNWILARANTWTGVQTFNTNINFTGTARRITGDFSNATVANRVLFQTRVANDATDLTIVPNGTATYAAVSARSSDSENASVASFAVNGAAGVVELASSKTGSGAYLPLRFVAGNAERLRIDPTTGNVLATSGAIGYGVGAGGTVVQATSKTTAVTLNKPSGQITMHNASLAAGASAGFAVTNSTVTTSDSVSVTGLTSPADAGNYRIEAIWVASGAFAIRVTNITAVARAEAVVINFNVHKGATS